MSGSAAVPDSTEIARLRGRLVHAAVRHPDLFLEHAVSTLISVACQTAAGQAVYDDWALQQLRTIVAKLPDHETGKVCPS